MAGYHTIVAQPSKRRFYRVLAAPRCRLEKRSLGARRINVSQVDSRADSESNDAITGDFGFYR